MICRGGACDWSPCEYCSRSEPRTFAERRRPENLRRRSNLYIHSVDEEVKNDYQERTYAKDVQSTVGGIGKGGK